MPTSTTASTAPAEVDARITRFTAGVTAVVVAGGLAVANVNPPVGAAILAAQAVISGIGAHWGPPRHPYGRIFTSVLAPRLGPVTKRDAVAQVRFAQMLGVVFCGVGAAGFALGAPEAGGLSAGLALLAALVRATFGICLSRGPYMLVCRLRGEVPACCRNK